MAIRALAIFTGKVTPTILEVGGSQSWTLDRNKARQCDYAVLFFNDHAPWSTRGYTEHGQAFFVGHISDVVQSQETPDRWLVTFDRYAEVKGVAEWGGWRNPIRYATLDELGVDIAKLDFKPMPERQRETEVQEPSASAAPLTIEAAKAGLAATFGVKPDAIEIVIRG